jgi:hypothetical protein
VKILRIAQFRLKGGKKMSKLRTQNLEKCFSLLREYIDETPLNNKKENAILALNQLQKITAGTNSTGSSDADGSNPTDGLRSTCHGRPKAE